MLSDAKIVCVLIASPGDVPDDRDMVESVVREWNATYSIRERIALLPLRWEVNAVSDLHLDTQTAINEQLVEHADIVIALFHSRLGTPTPRALSGTVEELDRALARGVRVHGYFNSGPLPGADQIDVGQLQALLAFKEEWRRRGLCADYATLDALAVQIRRAVADDIARLRGWTPDRNRDEGTAVTARYSVEATDFAGTRSYIEVCNSTDRSMRNVSFSLDTDDDGVPPLHRFKEMDAIDIAPHNTILLPVYSCIGMSQRWRLTVRWLDGSARLESTLLVKVDPPHEISRHLL
ncbi:hypothetical protein [Nocardia nepalensis]|uniref:hypothetical protein n=1 Tax=Nocardia nepalensis TaxID=3375448 RepID=UPI003B67ADD2